MTTSPRFERFLNFLYNDLDEHQFEDRTDRAEKAAYLESQGVHLAELDASVTQILSRAGGSLPTAPAWLERARAQRRWFDEQVKHRTQELAKRYSDSKALMAAMLSGELGAGVQARAGVFFRNKNASDLSPEDLRIFVEDCELLESVLENSPESSGASDRNHRK